MGKMGKLNKTYMTLILPFLVLLALPGAFLFADAGGFLPNENRMAASFPELIDEQGEFDKSALEGFLNDNVGFRNFALLADTSVKYAVFHYFPDLHTIQGQDGQLYYSMSDKSEPRWISPFLEFSEEEAMECATNIACMAEYYSTKGSEFYFMLIPNKEEVYPEYYPDTVLIKPGISRMSQVADLLERDFGVAVVNVTEPLIAGKTDSDVPVWHESGDFSHWTKRGALIGYTSMMERLQGDVGELRILTENDFVVTTSLHQFRTGDGYYAFPDLWNTWMTYERLYVPEGRMLDRYVEDIELSDAVIACGYVDWYIHYVNPERDGTLLIIGDSFTHSFLMEWYAESFGDVIFMNSYNDAKTLRKASDIIAPDLVIYEMVDRSYKGDSFEGLQAYVE